MSAFSMMVLVLGSNVPASNLPSGDIRLVSNVIFVLPSFINAALIALAVLATSLLVVVAASRSNPSVNLPSFSS